MRAVHAWQPSGSPQQIERLAALRTVADLRARLLDDVTSGVGALVERVHATDVAVTCQVVYGHPARELIREAGADSLLVVGSRGRGGITGSLLGSVSQSCAQYAASTVVVVPGRRPSDGTRRVVVGVDGSATSVRALRFADDAAGLRNAALHVVHAWTVPHLGLSGRAMTVLPDAVDDIRQQAQATLQDSLKRASLDPAGPGVAARLAPGPAAPSLLQAAEGADLLVVGSRGYGGWKGLLLGSVSLQCVTQAPCPVAVIRDQDDDVASDEAVAQ